MTGNGRLCFVTCFDEGFLAGARGLVRSIRRLYGADEASIVAFADRAHYGLRDFCDAYECELQLFGRIEQWALPLIYSNPIYRSDRTHFYHPDFVPDPQLPWHEERRSVGFDTLRHLHPWHVKAYCTAYGLLVRPHERLVYIDADAFLLWRIDDLIAPITPNTVIGFDEGEDALPNLERLYGVRRPASMTPRTYAFNAGVVVYRNGPGIRTLLLDFMHYAESCHHFGTPARSAIRAFCARWSPNTTSSATSGSSFGTGPTGIRPGGVPTICASGPRPANGSTSAAAAVRSSGMAPDG